MSTRIPMTLGRPRPANLAVLMREVFIALNDLVFVRLAERGYHDIRPAHGAVFQYLDDDGTTVAVLAERAQMTKQAMTELVRHLETHGFVTRVADPVIVGRNWWFRASGDVTSSLSPRISFRKWSSGWFRSSGRIASLP